MKPNPLSAVVQISVIMAAKISPMHLTIDLTYLMDLFPTTLTIATVQIFGMADLGTGILNIIAMINDTLAIVKTTITAI